MNFENLVKITLGIIRHTIYICKIASFTRFWYNTIFVLTFNRFCWNRKPIILNIRSLQDSASESKIVVNIRTYHIGIQLVRSGKCRSFLFLHTRLNLQLQGHLLMNSFHNVISYRVQLHLWSTRQGRLRIRDKKIRRNTTTACVEILTDYAGCGSWL